MIDSLRQQSSHDYLMHFETIKQKINTVKKANWKYDVCQTNPQQTNGSDCGLAICLNAVKIAKFEDKEKLINLKQE